MATLNGNCGYNYILLFSSLKGVEKWQFFSKTKTAARETLKLTGQLFLKLKVS
jgi:hypothetical protein